MRRVPILTLAENVTAAPYHFDGTKTYFATGDIVASGLLLGTPVAYVDRPSRANLAAKKDDVLFAKMQATEKVHHVDEASEESIFSTGFFNIRSTPGILHPRYLYWYLRSPQFNLEKDKLCTGATQKALTLAGLRQIEIPLPPSLEDQKRIASILDKADRIRWKRKDTLDCVERLLMSEFSSRFGSPFSNSKGLPMAPIKAFGKVVTGNTPPRNHPENYGEFIEWIKSDNINTPYHHLTKSAEGLSERGKSIGRVAPAGSTLVTWPAA